MSATAFNPVLASVKQVLEVCIITAKNLRSNARLIAHIVRPPPIREMNNLVDDSVIFGNYIT